MSNASVLIEERLNRSFITTFPFDINDDFDLFNLDKAMNFDLSDPMKRMSLKK